MCLHFSEISQNYAAHVRAVSSAPAPSAPSPQTASEIASLQSSRTVDQRKITFSALLGSLNNDMNAKLSHDDRSRQIESRYRAAESQPKMMRNRQVIQVCLFCLLVSCPCCLSYLRSIVLSISNASVSISVSCGCISCVSSFPCVVLSGCLLLFLACSER